MTELHFASAIELAEKIKDRAGYKGNFTFNTFIVGQTFNKWNIFVP